MICHFNTTNFDYMLAKKSNNKSLSNVFLERLIAEEMNKSELHSFKKSAAEKKKHNSEPILRVQEEKHR